jgi:hypothetical protein
MSNITPGSYLYKYFKQIINNWPIEQSKAKERNFRYFLERRLEVAFKQQSNNPDSADHYINMLQPDVNIKDCKLRLQGINFIR